MVNPTIPVSLQPPAPTPTLAQQQAARQPQVSYRPMTAVEQEAAIQKAQAEQLAANRKNISGSISVWQERLDNLQRQSLQLEAGGLSSSEKAEYYALDDRMDEARAVLESLQSSYQKGLDAGQAASIASSIGSREIAIQQANKQAPQYTTIPGTSYGGKFYPTTSTTFIPLAARQEMSRIEQSQIQKQTTSNIFGFPSTENALTRAITKKDSERNIILAKAQMKDLKEVNIPTGTIINKQTGYTGTTFVEKGTPESFTSFVQRGIQATKASIIEPTADIITAALSGKPREIEPKTTGDLFLTNLKYDYSKGVPGKETISITSKGVAGTGYTFSSPLATYQRKTLFEEAPIVSQAEQRIQTQADTISKKYSELARLYTNDPKKLELIKKQAEGELDKVISGVSKQYQEDFKARDKVRMTNYLNQQIYENLLRTGVVSALTMASYSIPYVGKVFLASDIAEAPKMGKETFKLIKEYPGARLGFAAQLGAGVLGGLGAGAAIGTIKSQIKSQQIQNALKESEFKSRSLGQLTEQKFKQYSINAEQQVLLKNELAKGSSLRVYEVYNIAKKGFESNTPKVNAMVIEVLTREGEVLRRLGIGEAKVSLGKQKLNYALIQQAVGRLDQSQGTNFMSTLTLARRVWVYDPITGRRIDTYSGAKEYKFLEETPKPEQMKIGDWNLYRGEVKTSLLKAGKLKGKGKETFTQLRMGAVPETEGVKGVPFSITKYTGGYKPTSREVKMIIGEDKAGVYQRTTFLDLAETSTKRIIPRFNYFKEMKPMGILEQPIKVEPTIRTVGGKELTMEQFSKYQQSPYWKAYLKRTKGIAEQIKPELKAEQVSKTPTTIFSEAFGNTLPKEFTKGITERYAFMGEIMGARTRLDIDTSSLIKVQPNLGIGTKIKMEEETTPIFKFGTVISPVSESRLNEQQSFIPKTDVSTALVPELIQQQQTRRPAPPTVITPIVPTIQTPIRLKFKFPGEEKQKTGRAFGVYVLREATKKGKKRWEKIGSGLPQITAMSIGASETARSISRRFKVVPEAEGVEAKNIVIRTYERLQPMFRSFAQKGGMKVALPKGEYIQKAKFALSSRQEVKEIQKARRMSARLY